LKRAVESLARRTTRRGLFRRGLDGAFGALAGAAAGAALRPDGASAGFTVCGFPGPPCPCNTCRATGVCAKPCLIFTNWYASGCWYVPPGPLTDEGVTCCDCDCSSVTSFPACGCGSDYHNDPENCPQGNAG
jgi:hypothetical protein